MNAYKILISLKLPTMKNIFAIFLILTVLFSCSKESTGDTDVLTYKGKWSLVKITGSFSSTVTEGLDMEWQEDYMLNYDGTFTKTRTTKDTILIATGTYRLLDESEFMNTDNSVKYLETTFDTNSTLLANCYSQSLTEYLYFANDLKLRNTYNACDGLGLEYAKE